VVDWKLRKLKLTVQSTTQFRHRPINDASNGMSGRLGGAQGMAWFGFCLLSSVFYVLVFCVFFNGFVFDGCNNDMEEC